MIPEDLRRFTLFASYADEEIHAFVEPYLTELAFAQGQVICRERAPGDSCYFLVEGTVEVQTTIASGKVEPIAQLKSGQIFGQVVLLDGGNRSATCVAATECRLYELTRADFDALRAGDSPFAFDLLIEIGSSLAKQLRMATENLSAMSEARVEDPAALSTRLEAFLRGEPHPSLSKMTDSGLLRIKDFEL